MLSPMATETPRKRRTQEERREETRGRLLDATVECLLQYGYAGTTTTLVAERAGVSRGAQLHHFPKKADLVRAAIEHVFHRRVAEFRATMERIPAEGDRLSTAIDLLWESYRPEGAFYPCLEFMVAARTDSGLREHLATVTYEILETVRRTFAEYFPEYAAGNPFGDIAPWVTIALMDGLALGQMAIPHEETVRRILTALKQIAAVMQPSLGQETNDKQPREV